MADSTDNKRKRQRTGGETDDFLESLTPAQIGAALGYWFDHAAALQAANAEQIKALIKQVRALAEMQARTDKQVRLLIGAGSLPQAGPIAETGRGRAAGEEDARDKRLMNDLGVTEIGSDAELPDRPRAKDVARWLGIHQNTVYQLIHKGEIPCKRVGKRTYIFDKAALFEWLESSSSVPELAIRRGAR